MSFISGVSIGLTFHALRILHRMASKKYRFGRAFAAASSKFYESALTILNEEGPMPDEAINLLRIGGNILASRKMTLEFAKLFAQDSGAEQSKVDWSEVNSRMTDRQRKLFIEASASLVEAAMHSSILYHSAILQQIYSTARARPGTKFGVTELKLGAARAARVSEAIAA